MADSGPLKYSKLIVFINTGCTKILRAVLIQHVLSVSPDTLNPWTLDDFLHTNRSKIYMTPYGKKRKLDNHHERVLFPGFGIRTNVEKWDLQLLALVVLDVCSPLPSWIKMDIGVIKKVRNFLCHTGEAIVDDLTYEAEMETLRIICNRIIGFISHEETKKELCSVVDKTEFAITEALYQESMRQLRNWCESDKSINDKLDTLMQGQEQIMALLQRNLALLPDNSKAIEIPDTDVILSVKNCTTDKELYISQRLVSLLDPKLRTNLRLTQELSEEGLQDVNTAVQQAILELLDSGKEVVEAQPGCVIMKIRCLTFEALCDLWNRTVTGEITAVFKGVEQALRDKYPTLELEVYMTEDEWLKCVYQLVRCLMEHFGWTLESTDLGLLDPCVHTQLASNEGFSQIKAVRMEGQFVPHDVQSVPSEGQSDDGGTKIVLSIAPKSHAQRKNMMEFIKNGSFNEHLRAVEDALMALYDTKNIRIMASTASGFVDTTGGSQKQDCDDDDDDDDDDDNGVCTQDTLADRCETVMNTQNENEHDEIPVDRSNVWRKQHDTCKDTDNAEYTSNESALFTDDVITEGKQNTDNADFACLKGFYHIMEDILAYLDPQSLSAAEQVCSAWYDIIIHRNLWSKLMERMVRSDNRYQAMARKRGWHLSDIHKLDRQYLKKQIALLKGLEFSWRNCRYHLDVIHPAVPVLIGTRSIQADNDSSGIYSVQADNNKIVTGGKDNLVKVWDRKTLALQNVLSGHKGSVLCVAFDDRVILTSAVDDDVWVWDVNTGKCLNHLNYHKGRVMNFKFKDNLLVTASEDRSVCVAKMFTPGIEIQLERVLVGHRAAVNSVDFDDNLIVSASGDRTLKVWDTQTYEFKHTLLGHLRGISSVKLMENLAVSGGSDGTIRLWDIHKGACIRVLSASDSLVRCLDFDQNRIVSGSYDGMIRIWDLKAALDDTTPEDKLCIHTLRDHTDKVFCIQMDHFHIVSGDSTGRLLIRDFLDVQGE